VKNAQRTLTVIIFYWPCSWRNFLSHKNLRHRRDQSRPAWLPEHSLDAHRRHLRQRNFLLRTIGSILLVLSLSANTAFADFPRLCRAIALNNYLPHVFSFRGRRLVYTSGIIVLAILTCILLVLFGGVTDGLIPLYAVGAFLAFTLSQFGMVMHWRKNRGPHWMKSALVNGFGGFVTGVTVIVVLVAKFIEGAWITLLFIPLLIVFFTAVRRHYHSVRTATTCTTPVIPAIMSTPPIAVVPWIAGAASANRRSNSRRGSRRKSSPSMWSPVSIRALHEGLERYVEEPFRAAGVEPPKLTILPSPYRFVIVPIVQYVIELSKKHPEPPDRRRCSGACRGSLVRNLSA